MSPKSTHQDLHLRHWVACPQALMAAEAAKVPKGNDCCVCCLDIITSKMIELQQQLIDFGENVYLIVFLYYTHTKLQPNSNLDLKVILYCTIPDLWKWIKMNLIYHSIDFTYSTQKRCILAWRFVGKSKLSPCSARKSGLFKPLSPNKFFIPRIVFNYLPCNYDNTHMNWKPPINPINWSCLDIVFLLSKSYSEEMNENNPAETSETKSTFPENVLL